MRGFRARILEKQNSLQMSQVFSFARIGDQMGLAFQGFYKRDRRTDKLSDSQAKLNMHTQIKNQTLPAAAINCPNF
jgi:hypothetical protein